MEVLIQAISEGVNLRVQADKVRRDKARTFIAKERGKWVHKTYPGAIVFENTGGRLLSAKIRVRGDQFPNQILEAFVGFLMRHLRDEIQSVHLTILH